MGDVMDLYDRARAKAERYASIVAGLPERDRIPLARWVLSGTKGMEGLVIDLWVQWWIQRAVEHYNLTNALQPWKRWHITAPPTQDPQIAGRVWNNNGVLTLSAGPV